MVTVAKLIANNTPDIVRQYIIHLKRKKQKPRQIIADLESKGFYMSWDYYVYHLYRNHERTPKVEYIFEPNISGVYFERIFICRIHGKKINVYVKFTDNFDFKRPFVDSYRIHEFYATTHEYN